MAWTRLAVIFAAVAILTVGSKAVSGSYVDEDRGHLILEKLVRFVSKKVHAAWLFRGCSNFPRSCMGFVSRKDALLRVLVVRVE